MARIDQIESISDKLAETTIAVLPKRCSYIRNWHSQCKACLNACPQDAIERSVGHLSIDSELCTNCGACVTACPTSTFLTTAPHATEIVREARLSAEELDGHAVLACAPLTDVESIDPSKVAVLPCLDYLDEYLICGLFRLGIKSVTLLKGPCEQCPHECPQPLISETVGTVKGLLAQWGVNAHVRLTEKIPSQIRPSRHNASKRVSGASRRDSFRQAGGSVLGYVSEKLGEAVHNFTGDENKPKPSSHITVRIDELFDADTYRSVRMLNMLDSLGTRPSGQVLDTRLWADVRIDPVKCRRCGMCSNMCVTRALSFTKHEDGTGTLTFTPSLCVGCRLCKDTCFTRSMIYNTKVNANDLSRDVVKTLFDHEKDEKKTTSFFN